MNTTRPRACGDDRADGVGGWLAAQVIEDDVHVVKSHQARAGVAGAPIASLAPRCTAIARARRPALPPAPRTRTREPGLNSTRRRRPSGVRPTPSMPGISGSASVLV